jgi:hypothetical protein
MEPSASSRGCRAVCECLDAERVPCVRQAVPISRVREPIRLRLVRGRYAFFSPRLTPAPRLLDWLAPSPFTSLRRCVTLEG